MIFVLVPVHNRLSRLQPFVADLVSQIDAPDFRVIVVDAGSTDGTREFLASATAEPEIPGAPRIDVVPGDIDWWWSKAISAGLDHIAPELGADDKVLISTMTSHSIPTTSRGSRS